MSRYGFLARPRWIAFHVLVVVLIIVMINLAFWQLRRRHERQVFNATVHSREAAGPVAVNDVLPSGAPLSATSKEEWRNAEATGTYDASQQVLIRDRSLAGQPGVHVVTPLVLSDGSAVLVNRGFVPLGTNSGGPAIPAPTSGTVTVEGRVRPTQTRGLFGPHDPPTGHLAELNRVDVARLSKQLPYPVRPGYIELTAQHPPVASEYPKGLPEPSLNDGPHLSYAIQWTIFSICAVVGWILVVRKTARSNDKKAALAGASASGAATSVQQPLEV
jgi:cytochrome oxidase assembly protein ShyY1